MSNPYQNLDPKAFWKTGVASVNAYEIQDLWVAKFPITQQMSVATAGSCFAQHISRAMIAQGFNWVDSEPIPNGLIPALGRRFGYGVFSFRTGNIYTTALLRQWVAAAFGKNQIDDEIWEQKSCYFDPLRPAIEPDGFNSARELLLMRNVTLSAMRNVLSHIDLFVFTLGLTEGWRNRKTGTIYAACPGTLAGKFDSKIHEFYNQDYMQVYDDLNFVLELIREHNQQAKFLLTVSPVPLTATASGNHVLSATVYSKSVLRAVAGLLAQQRADTDYFPSFEIISSFPFRGAFYQPNQREVSQAGVDHVMKYFFSGLLNENISEQDFESKEIEKNKDVECEEVLLEAFAK